MTLFEGLALYAAIVSTIAFAIELIAMWKS